MSQEPFNIGQTVIWLSRILGTYGVDYIDEQVVTMTEAEVVRLTPKRVEIRVTSGNESRLVLVVRRIYDARTIRLSWRHSSYANGGRGIRYIQCALTPWRRFRRTLLAIHSPADE